MSVPSDHGEPGPTPLLLKGSGIWADEEPELDPCRKCNRCGDPPIVGWFWCSHRCRQLCTANTVCGSHAIKVYDNQQPHYRSPSEVARVEELGKIAPECFPSNVPGSRYHKKRMVGANHNK